MRYVHRKGLETMSRRIFQNMTDDGVVESQLIYGGIFMTTY